MAKLGAGALFAEYVASREVRGDMEQAQKLQEQLRLEVAAEEQAVRLARKMEEEKDLELARRLQLREVRAVCLPALFSPQSAGLRYRWF